MFNLIKNAPPIAVVLASLVLWASFAWGMPAEASPTEGEAEVAAEVAGPEPAAAPNKLTGWLYVGLGYWAGSSLNLNYGRYQGVLCATVNSYGTIDIGVLLGYRPVSMLAIACGVAWVKVGHFYPEYNPIFGPGSGHVEHSYTVGVPVEVQFTPVKGRVVGLGLVGHVNFNKEKIFGGVTVGIQLGKLK